MNLTKKSLPYPSQTPYGDEVDHPESDWLEISATLACWIGIAGLIFLIGEGAWADRGSKGFMPGAKPSNPFNSHIDAPHPSDPQHSMDPQHPPGGGNFFDDDDDDDLDDEAMFGNPSAHSMRPGSPSHNMPSHPSYSHPGAGGGFSPPSSSRSYSAGGASFSGPDPVMTDKGIAVGGNPPNGVVTKGKVSPINIDSETAEGSKATVTDFNFPDADILDIAKSLGKLTGKNFILDKDVKGRVTIISNSPITVGEAWKAFLTALDINGFALIPSGKYLRISRQRDARDKQLKTYTGDYSPDTDALITRVFPLKYISSEEVARTFRSFMPANSRIIPYEQTNTVIVTDTGSNIAKLAKMLEILDVEGYDAGIEVIPVKYASAAELSKLIDALIPGTSSPSSGGGGSPGAPRFGGGGGKFSARRTKEGGIINTVIADERTNTLIVHANTKGADQVRELVAKLDQKQPASTGGGKVHVVYLQFADAEQLANTLNNFSSQTASKPAGGPPTSSGGGGTGINPIANALFEGAIRISPDKATNSLVITASPSDFGMINRVISKLDVPRDQVYVEVIIMEVSMGNNFSFSANVASAPSLLGSITNKDDLSSLTSVTNLLSSEGALLSFAAGQPYTLTANGQSITISSVQGLVKALQTNSNGNVLATPQVIALDNSEATFESAEKIPVPTVTNVQGVGAQTGYTREPVAISIKIKPQINKVTNFIKLDVTAKLGDISNRVPPGLSNQVFATLDRTAQTSVVVGDSDTVVIGGLIRDKLNETMKKIPILGDIPLLGWLFKSKTTDVQKSNLLVFMTPHIIRQYEKVRAILDKKLKERDEFIETNNGGDDGLRLYRDQIIRSLPDVKELTQKKPVTTFTIDEDKEKQTGTNPTGPNGAAADSAPPARAVENQPPTIPEDRGPSMSGPQPIPLDNMGAPQTPTEQPQQEIPSTAPGPEGTQ